MRSGTRPAPVGSVRMASPRGAAPLTEQSPRDRRPMHLESDRLLLRPWRDADLDPFAAMNDDPRVMEHFPRTYTRAETETHMRAAMRSLEAEGLGWMALEEKATGRFIGFVGLIRVDFEAPFVPAVEVGWRLVVEAWGKGYASEAARMALADGFGRLGLQEIVSFTAVPNLRSQAVMRRIGMTHDPDGDFLHPLLADGHPLQRHVLYRIRPEALSKPLQTTGPLAI